MKKQICSILLYNFFLLFTLCSFAQGNYIIFNESKLGLDETDQPKREIIDNGCNSIEIEYIFPGAYVSIKSENQEIYQLLKISNFGFLQDEGKPALPSHIDLVLVPRDARIQIEIIESDFEILRNYNIYPAQEPHFDDGKYKRTDFMKDENMYKSNKFFPSKIVNISDIQKLRNNELAFIQVNPIQFNPVKKELKIFYKLKFKISFSGGESSFAYLEKENTSEFIKFLNNIIINNKYLPKRNKIKQKINRTRDNDDRKDYIIITHSDFINAANSLANWKRQLGYTVEVVSQDSWTTEQVDNAIEIRFNSWTPHPDYFVIIGDNEQVPGEMVPHYKPQYGDLVTDLYYAVIDEQGGNYIPEMKHGRISVSTSTEAINVIQKIINYESNPPSYSSNYYWIGLHCSYFEDDDDDTYADTRYAQTTEEAYDYINGLGYWPERIYYTYDSKDPQYWNDGDFSNGEEIPSYLKKPGFSWDGDADDITNGINSGCFYVFQRDHGGKTKWVHPEYNKSNIDDLNNANKLPIVFSISCNTGGFDHTEECFAEKFIRKENGGCSGIIAATDPSPSGWNDALALGIFDAIWPDLIFNFTGEGGTGNQPENHDPFYTQGFVLNQGLATMITTWGGDADIIKLQYELYHYFGDPAMKIWTTAPTQITTNPLLPSSITPNTTSISISNCNVDDALATLVYNNEIIGKITLNNGTGTINFNPLSNGELITLTISKHNFVPLVHNISVFSGATLSDYNLYPLQGTTNDIYTFSIIFTAPSNQPPNNPIEVIIDGQNISMTPQGSNWSQGVEYTYTSSPGEFSVGIHNFHFEGQQGNTNLRFPNQPGTYLTFEVVPENPTGINLTLNPYEVYENNPVTVTATLDQQVENHPINFYQDPYSGFFEDQNPVFTNSSGVATIIYFATEPGIVDITAVDGENSSTHDTKSLTILPSPYNIDIEISSARIGMQGNDVMYDVYARVYNNGSPYYEIDITYQTDAGVWENGLQTHTFYSTSYMTGDRLYYDCSKNTTAHINITVEGVTELYNLLIQCTIPPISPTATISATGVEALSFHPNDDKIAFSKNDEKVYIYDVSDGQVVNSFTFIGPETGNPADVYMVRYNPDGSKLLLGSEFGSRIVNSNTGSSLATNNSIQFYPSTDDCGDACWVNDNELLICSEDYDYNYCNAVFNSSLSPQQNLFIGYYLVSEVDAHGGYAVAAVCDCDDEGFTRLFNTNNWNTNYNYNPAGNGGWHLGCALSPDGLKTAINDDYNLITYIYNNNNHQEIINFSDNTNAGRMDWNPVHTEFLVSIHSNKVILWDVTTGNQFASSEGIAYGSDVDWSSDGEMFATAGGGQLKIFAPFDMEPPEVSIISPEDNFQTGNSSITLSGFITDDTEVSYAEYKVNGGVWNSLVLNSNDEFSETVNLIEGSNTILVRGFDIFGKSSTKTVTGTRIGDVQPPLIYNVTSNNTEPEIGEDIIVSAAITDSWSGVNNESVECQVYLAISKTYLTFPMVPVGDDIYEGTIPTTTFIEDYYFVDIYAEDNSANAALLSEALNFRPFDLPVFDQITVLPENITNFDQITISVEITDQSGIINALLYFDDDPSLADPVIFNMTLNIDKYESIIPPQTGGTYYFYIEAMDGIGKINNSDVNYIEVGCANYQITLKVYLEGPFNGTDMNPNPYILPLTQPFNIAPWNYSGTENVVYLPNPNIVDWILVELRETSGDVTTATSSTIISKQAGFLLNDGSIVGIDGYNPMDFSVNVTQNLYVVIWHRNHLGIISSQSLIADGCTYNYDFSQDEDAAYNGNLAQKELAPGIWGMIGADGDANGTVDLLDEDLWSTKAGESGYKSADYNLNGEVDNRDKNDVWLPSLGSSTQIPLGSTIPTEGLIAYYPFNGDAIDATGNGNDGEPFGGVNFNTPDRFGNPNSASCYDGIDDYIWLGENSSLQLPNFSICSWFNSSNTSGYLRIYRWRWYGVTLELANGLIHAEYCGTTTFNSLYSNNIYADGNWHLAVFTYDGSYYRLFIDGQQEDFDFSDDPVYYGGGGAAIGRDGDYSGNYFDGFIDDVRIYDHALNITEINQLYNEPSVWQCGDPLIDNRDGQTYNTVQIGTQCWMAENLNIGIRIDGTLDQTQNTPTEITEKYCYDDLESNCDIYGGLYQWNEMMQYVTTEETQGICPDGWHLPTDMEWCILEQEVDPTITCSSIGFRGTDGVTKLVQGGSSGFEAIMAGNRNPNTAFYDIGMGTNFWNSTENGSNAWYRYLGMSYNKVYRDSQIKSFGFSVRCLKDETTNQPPTQPSNPSPDNGATEQSVNTTLSWTCTDPENDPLTYDVYFGETNPPVLISTGQTANTFDPGTLNYNLTYYWKILAHDDHTNSTNGPVWNFTTEPQPWQCGDDFLDTRDSKTYGTVQVGTQCWMAENLNIGDMISGNQDMSDDGDFEKYCFNNNVSSCNTYGGLYQWNELMQYSTTPGIQGICPEGWHVPTDSEWCTL